VAQCSWQSVCRLFDGYLQAQIPATAAADEVSGARLTPHV